MTYFVEKYRDFLIYKCLNLTHSFLITLYSKEGLGFGWKSKSYQTCAVSLILNKSISLFPITFDIWIFSEVHLNRKA